MSDVPASELRRPLINSIQLQISRINTNGDMDGQRKLEFFPSLCEDADELEKSPFPDRPGKDFDEDLFPDTPRSGYEKPKSGVRSLEVRVTSVRTHINVIRNGLAEPLHSALDCLTVRRGLSGIGHISQPRNWTVRGIRVLDKNVKRTAREPPSCLSF